MKVILERLNSNAISFIFCNILQSFKEIFSANPFILNPLKTKFVLGHYFCEVLNEVGNSRKVLIFLENNLNDQSLFFKGVNI